MQINYFSTGGFVAHKVSVPGYKSKFSAWFDKCGRLIDAARIDAKWRSFPVAKDSKSWRYLSNGIAGHRNETDCAISKAIREGRF